MLTVELGAPRLLTRPGGSSRQTKPCCLPCLQQHDRSAPQLHLQTCIRTLNYREHLNQGSVATISRSPGGSPHLTMLLRTLLLRGSSAATASPRDALGVNGVDLHSRHTQMHAAS